MLVVVEPSLQSVVTATRIHALADKIGIRNVSCIDNMVRDDADRSFIEHELGTTSFSVTSRTPTTVRLRGRGAPRTTPRRGSRLRSRRSGTAS